MQLLISSLIAPHYCCSCGVIGELLCESCKYDIVSNTTNQCLNCMTPVARFGDVCSDCRTAYERGWFVSLHRDSLRQLVESYKFSGAKQAGLDLAALLHQALPTIPDDFTVVTVPTLRSHVRVRGYDHAELLARSFAGSRSLPFASPLWRRHQLTQRGANRQERYKQAESAFDCYDKLSGSYILIDDVCTTGATLHFAAQALHRAGAQTVWAVAVTREPLD